MEEENVSVKIGHNDSDRENNSTSVRVGPKTEKKHSDNNGSSGKRKRLQEGMIRENLQEVLILRMRSHLRSKISEAVAFRCGSANGQIRRQIRTEQ